MNLYGPEDNFNPQSSHVIPALIRKVYEAQQAGATQLEVWGDGTPTREFLYSEDAARGIIMAMEDYNESDPINLGTNSEVSIRDLVTLICRLMGFKGDVVWLTDKPNGQPRRCLDTAKAKEKFGFTANITLEQGLQNTIDWYRQHPE